MPRMCWRQRGDGRELGGVRLPVRLIGLAAEGGGAVKPKERAISSDPFLIPHPLRRSRDLNFQPRFSQNSALGPTEIRYGGMAHVSWKVRFHRIPFTRRKVVAIAI